MPPLATPPPNLGCSAPLCPRYNDNKPIIELIAKKPGGVLSFVDDECQKRTATNDMALLENLNAKFNKSPYQDKIYSKPKQPGRFVIHHFAGEVSAALDIDTHTIPPRAISASGAPQVSYTIDGFISKNKDELSPTICALLEQHTCLEQLKELARAEKRKLEVAVLDQEVAKGGKGKKKGKGGGSGKRTRKKTVSASFCANRPRPSTQTFPGLPRTSRGPPMNLRLTFAQVSESFGESLNSLMDKLGATDHHYIRCLKPNHSLCPGVFDDELMLRQLAYSGTLEVTKVRKAGLNVRWELARFFGTYKICARDMAALRASSMREQCTMLLLQVGFDVARGAHADGFF